jgi:hypothetical protein
VELPAWGVAVIALYSLLQIPAVLFLARYCEVDTEDLPTPPMRAHWRGDEPSEAPSDAPTPEAKEGSTEPTTRTAPDQRNSKLPTPPDHSAEANAVRCTRCGTTNDPAFARCRCCVARL